LPSPASCAGWRCLDLDYQLKQRQLKGRNNIVAKQLYLGEAVASEQAVDAPVALGLALLRDVSGVIDLDVDVKGDLDDPGFSVAGVVLKALMNVLVKAAASPFQLLASLVGGSEDLGQLEFAAGSGDLSATEQAQLNQLAQALQQRPQLAVDIRGNASAEADLAALQLLRVRDLIAAQRKLAPAELPLETLLDDEDNRDELDDLNDALELPDADDREDALVNADPALKGQDLTAQVYRQMLQDVASRQTIDTQNLLMLADQRALAIKQYLVETAGLDHQRVQMAKTRKRDLKGRICELGLIPAQ
jgi:outer membrane protein OmpA-like peptidoglycan-associated protein